MKTIVIVGGGYGASRYVESLIWDSYYEIIICGTGYCGQSQTLSLSFGLKYIRFEDLENYYNIDCVILAIPPSVRQYYVDILINVFRFNGIVICEKPLFINGIEADFYRNVSNRLAVVCQRDFFKGDYLIDKHQTSYSVSFPTLFPKEADNIIHVMPHILSWFSSQGISISETIRYGNNSYYCKNENKTIDIVFYERKNDRELVCINDKPYANVNYRLCNAKIVKDIFNFQSDDFRMNITRAINVSCQISCILHQYFKV